MRALDASTRMFKFSIHCVYGSTHSVHALLVSCFTTGLRLYTLYTCVTCIERAHAVACTTGLQNLTLCLMPYALRLIPCACMPPALQAGRALHSYRPLYYSLVELKRPLYYKLVERSTSLYTRIKRAHAVACFTTGL